jgi:CheY-like chemotaxis protein
MPRNSIKKLLQMKDNPGDARLLREMLNDRGLCRTEGTHVEQLGDAEKYLVDHEVGILLDLGLPDAQGLGALQRARACGSLWLSSELVPTTAMARTSTHGVGEGIEFTGIDDATQKWLALGRLRRQRN